MTDAVRILHYLNQFFGGRGGEEAAGMPVSFVEGPLGPGRLLAQCLGGAGRIIGTVVGGDGYVAEQGAAATSAFAAARRAGPGPGLPAVAPPHGRTARGSGPDVASGDGGGDPPD